MSENQDEQLDDDENVDIENEKNMHKKYKSQTLRTMRAALNRYFKEKRRIDIIADIEFYEANEMFKCVLKVNKSQRLGEIESKEAITDDDMIKLNEHFTRNMLSKPNAQNLQLMMIFYIIFQFGRRSRENLRKMKKNTFQLGKDPDGRQFVYQAIDEMDKKTILKRKLRRQTKEECTKFQVQNFFLFLLADDLHLS